jgi:streptomycin 6-kinase
MTKPLCNSVSARERLLERARHWGVIVDETFETATSLIAFGRRARQPVAIKIVKREGDEWRAGELLDAFGGNGVVRVYEFAPGASLLERLLPGSALTELSLDGRDDEATEIIADVILRMSPVRSVAWPTVQNWSLGFDRYIATADGQIPKQLVGEARDLYVFLCDSQTRPRLLHGDLQHYNVLFDADRGWLAIDPKGVIGEIEYEVGAALRNPVERPELFATTAIVERRLAALTSKLGLDPARAVAWSFAQAVLSAIWDVEDGFAIHPRHPAIQLAQAIRPLLPNFVSP